MIRKTKNPAPISNLRPRSMLFFYFFDGLSLSIFFSFFRRKRFGQDPEGLTKAAASALLPLKRYGVATSSLSFGTSRVLKISG